jgi:hypothetical protein
VGVGGGVVVLVVVVVVVMVVVRGGSDGGDDGGGGGGLVAVGGWRWRPRRWQWLVDKLDGWSIELARWGGAFNKVPQGPDPPITHEHNTHARTRAHRHEKRALRAARRTVAAALA